MSSHKPAESTTPTNAPQTLAPRPSSSKGTGSVADREGRKTEAIGNGACPPRYNAAPLHQSHTRDISGQNETAADPPLRVHNIAPTSRPPSPARTQPSTPRSQTPPWPTPVDPKPQSRLNRRDRPRQSETLADANDRPNHRIPDPAPPTTPEKREICVESETPAESPNPNTPAHPPASSFQLLTSNSQLLASTSPPRQAPPPKTYEECVESVTFLDTANPNISPPSLDTRPLPGPRQSCTPTQRTYSPCPIPGPPLPSPPSISPRHRNHHSPPTPFHNGQKSCMRRASADGEPMPAGWQPADGRAGGKAPDVSRTFFP